MQPKFIDPSIPTFEQATTVAHGWKKIASGLTVEEAALTALDFTHDTLACIKRLNECEAESLHKIMEILKPQHPQLAEHLKEFAEVAGHTVVAGCNLLNVVGYHNERLGQFKQKYCPCVHCRDQRKTATPKFN